MRSRDEFDLLRELLRLRGRYGANIFARLAVLLAESTPFDDIAQVLERSTPVGPPEGTRKQARDGDRVGGRTSAERLLEQLDETTQELARSAIGALRRRELLPTLQEMRTFSQAHSLGHVTASSRKAALPRFILAIIGGQQADVCKRLEAMYAWSPDKSERSDLAAWSKVILKPSRSVAGGQDKQVAGGGEVIVGPQLRLSPEMKELLGVLCDHRSRTGNLYMTGDELKTVLGWDDYTLTAVAKLLLGADSWPVKQLVTARFNRLGSSATETVAMVRLAADGCRFCDSDRPDLI